MEEGSSQLGPKKPIISKRFVRKFFDIFQANRYSKLFNRRYCALWNALLRGTCFNAKKRDQTKSIFCYCKFLVREVKRWETLTSGGGGDDMDISHWKFSFTT